MFAPDAAAAEAGAGENLDQERSRLNKSVRVNCDAVLVRDRKATTESHKSEKRWFVVTEHVRKRV